MASFLVSVRKHREIGSELHKKILEELTIEHRKTIHEAEAAVQAQAEREKRRAVKEAIKVVKKEHKFVIEDIEKEREKVIQEAVRQAEGKMDQEKQTELLKKQEAADLHLAEEIKKVLEACYEEKVEAVAHEKQRQKIIARRAQVLLKRALIQQQKRAHAFAAKKHQKSLQTFRENAVDEIKAAVAKAQKVEKEKARAVIKEAEEVQKQELEAFKEIVEEMKTHQQQDVELLETIENSKHELEEEIQEIREAFQKYINITLPMLGPGQADFLLPLRKKYMKEVEDGVVESPFTSKRNISHEHV
ncbi:uncharacterized protein C6orf163 homolog [Microcaecilia unicolor]|uniref:Uncharacterized protein C6orf163 homolog n=1 Tax=Microcaecilia unicolor TaxID=1415580 RepID=A0A6P7XEX8_9AMPH|nr:uncharacterized protein C6orf163 homolog [Microcaecilia unicolor]